MPRPLRTRPLFRRSRALAVIITALATVLGGAALTAGTATAAPSSRSAVTRSDAQAAADVLMSAYEPEKAWFPSSWWNSAVALQTIGDYMERTGDRRYVDELDNTFVKDQGRFPAGYLSGDELLGNFTSRAIDDSGWWALAWVQAYDLTGRQKYLDMAETIAKYMDGYYDTSTCGGGIWWNGERTYKNAVTNGQWVRLTAELHNRIRGDREWLRKSTTAWDWFTHSGMINADHLVNDGLTDACASNGDTVWSYNQGLAVGAGLELYKATGDRAVLAEAKKLADAGIQRPELVTDGVLTESCDPVGRTCDDNAKQFKGVFMRYLMELADTTGTPRYERFIQRQARTVLTQDRDDQGRLGGRYAGASTQDSPNVFDWRTQASALSAVIAALPARGGEKRSLSTSVAPAATVVLPSAEQSAQQDLTLTVAAAAPGTMTVDLRAKAPKGWKVSLPKSERIRSHRAVKEREVPVTLTIPAGVAEGTYDIKIIAKTGKLTWSSVAHVLVATSADFETGTDDEAPWLFDDNGSGSGGPGNRYADGDSSYTWRFPLPADTTTASLDLHINNQFVVQVSPDGATWTTVLRETEQIRDASNDAIRTVDLTPYLAESDGTTPRTVYVKVSDAFPDDGWGGQSSHVTVTADH